MSERTFDLSGPPEQAAAQLWAHLQEKTMLNGEKLPKFDSPEKAADVYLEHLTLEEVKKVVKALITTLQKMRTEREDIFEKNSALDDAVGKLIKEKVYLQRQLASAINSMTDQQKRMAAKYDQLNERRAQAKASAQSDLEQKSTEQTPEASVQ